MPTHRNLEEVAESYNADADLIKLYDEYRRERRDCGNPLAVSYACSGMQPELIHYKLKTWEHSRKKWLASSSSSSQPSRIYPAGDQQIC